MIGDESDRVPAAARRARGAASNRAGRFEAHAPAARSTTAGTCEEELPPLKTEVALERARTIITRNRSPDVPFDRSINPYRGCEHGCVYCFARPTHAYLGLSPGLDFETRLTAKPDAAKLLAAELARPGYRPAPIAIGTNTDPYQPIEKRLGIMRAGAGGAARLPPSGHRAHQGRADRARRRHPRRDGPGAAGAWPACR